MEYTQLVTTDNGLSILKPFDIQKEELQKLAADYSNLVVTKETYDEAIKARKVLRDVRLKVAGVLKDNKDILNSEKKKQESKAEELTAITEIIENRIDTGIKVIDEEKRQEKEKKEKEALVKIQGRMNLLHELGMKLVGDAYSLGEHQIGAVQIKVFADEEFNEFIELVKAEALIIANQKIEEENKRKSEAELIEKQRRENEEEKKRLEDIANAQKERQAQLDREELDRLSKLKKEQEERDAKIVAEQKKRDKEFFDKQEKLKKEQEDEMEKLRIQKEELINQIRAVRTKQIEALGLVFNPIYDTFTYDDINISTVELITLEQKEWDNLINLVTPIIKDRKETAELRKQEADRKEKERAESLKSDVELLMSLRESYDATSVLSSNIFKSLKDEKSIQILRDVQKMNEGIQEYIRLSIKNL